MPNFLDAISQENTKLDDIKDVPPLPVGSYLVMVNGHYEAVKSTQKQTDGIQFNLRLMQARDDVDQEALQAYLSASNRTLMDITLKHIIWDSLYALTTLRDFLKDTLAISGSKGTKEALADVPGQQFIVTMIHRPFTDNSGNARLRAEIGSTARAL